MIQRFKQFLTESKNYSEVIDWLNTLKLDGRVPRGMKQEYEILNYIQRKINMVDDFYRGKAPIELEQEVEYHYQRLEQENDIDAINTKFAKNSKQPTTIKKGDRTYIKQDGSAYKKFQTAITQLESLFKSLKGKHKIPVKNLTIRFVKKSLSKSKAKYKTDKDELWINLQSMGKTSEEYGSLVYVALHELGHRYLRYNRQSWAYDDNKWNTTRYSTIQTISTNEEKFAELFAMSHWKSKYKQYSDKIEEFEEMIQ